LPRQITERLFYFTIGCHHRSLEAEADKATRTKLRTASGFDGFGSGWRAIQASRSASRSGWTRTPMVRPLPVAGRPIFFFSRSAIAEILTFG